MRVFRVEHENFCDYRTGLGCGPYTGRWKVLDESQIDGREAVEAVEHAFDVLNDVTYGYDTHSSRLIPACDPSLRGIRRTEACGFDTMEALHNWFRWALEPLKGVGYGIREYEVPDDRCRVGRDGQTLFDYRYAVRVHESEESSV